MYVCICRDKLNVNGKTERISSQGHNIPKLRERPVRPLQKCSPKRREVYEPNLNRNDAKISEGTRLRESSLQIGQMAGRPRIQSVPDVSRTIPARIFGILIRNRVPTFIRDYEEQEHVNNRRIQAARANHQAGEGEHMEITQLDPWEHGAFPKLVDREYALARLEQMDIE